MKDAVRQRREFHTGLELELFAQHLPSVHKTLSSVASLINQTPALLLSPVTTALCYLVSGGLGTFPFAVAEVPVCGNYSLQVHA